MKRRSFVGALVLTVLALVSAPGGAQYVNDPPTPGIPVFVQYTLTAGAVALSDSTILNSTSIPKKLTIKNANGAANVCYLGGALVANTPTGAGIELAADQAYTFTNQMPSQIFIVGTVNAANIAFIVAEY